eukprot:gene23040-9399_t
MDAADGVPEGPTKSAACHFCGSELVKHARCCSWCGALTPFEEQLRSGTPLRGWLHKLGKETQCTTLEYQAIRT